jgi:hypothetical protein
VERLTANATGKIRYVDEGGRRHIVAPLSLIVPGVLNGSKGPLLYELNEIRKNAGAWEDVPLTLGHPTDMQGRNLSAKDPGVLQRQGLGFVRRPTVKNKLGAEGWFDVDRTMKLRPDIVEKLESGQPIELSTGLFTDNEEAAANANLNGKPYTHIARNFAPDHVAVLPDHTGACSLKDGCGVLVNGRQMLVVNGSVENEKDALGHGSDSTGDNTATDSQLRFPHLAHLMNGRQVHSAGHSKSDASDKARALIASGTHASVLQDPKAPRGAQHMVMVPTHNALAKSSVGGETSGDDDCDEDDECFENNDATGENPLYTPDKGVTNARSMWQRFGEFLGVINEKDAVDPVENEWSDAARAAAIAARSASAKAHEATKSGVSTKHASHADKILKASAAAKEAGDNDKHSSAAKMHQQVASQLAASSPKVAALHRAAGRAHGEVSRLTNNVGDEEMSFATNGEMSHSDVHAALHSELQKQSKQSDPPANVHSVYDKHMIYEQGGSHYKQGYSKSQDDDGRGQVVLKGKPVKMLKQVSFTPTEDDRNTTNLDESGSSVTNEEEELDMPKELTANERKELVEKIVKNSGCCENKEDRDALGRLSDAALNRMAANEKAEGSNSDTSGAKGAKKQAGGKGTKDEYTEEPDDTTKNEAWLKDAPPQIRQAVVNAMAITERERASIIQALTANLEGDEQKRQQTRLLNRSLEDLREDFKLLPARNQQGMVMPSAAMYLGQASPIGNQGNPYGMGGDRLTEEQKHDTIPIANWSKVYEENSKLRDKEFKTA